MTRQKIANNIEQKQSMWKFGRNIEMYMICVIFYILCPEQVKREMENHGKYMANLCQKHVLSK